MNYLAEMKAFYDTLAINSLSSHDIWDEFDSHAGVTDLNDGEEASWNSVVEKQNDLIEEARRLGLCSFGNAYAAYKGICVIMKPQGVLTPGSTWEIGCKSFVSNAGDNIRIRVYLYATRKFTPYIVPSKVDKSALYDMECPHITVTIPDTAVDAQGCYVEILNLSSVPYNTLADGSKEYHKAVIKDFYMYDVNEENVIVRGVNPANTWLQICRVTDARLAADTSLVSNALYITDSGKMFITDFNGKKVNLIT